MTLGPAQLVYAGIWGGNEQEARKSGKKKAKEKNARA